MMNNKPPIIITISLIFWPLIARADVIVNPRTDDLWDLSQGTSITAHSAEKFGFPVERILSETSTIDALFTDGQFENFVHFFEWQTPADVTVRSFSLIANHDGAPRDARYRGFKTFRLLGFNDSSSQFETLFELTGIPLQYSNVTPQPNMFLDTSYPEYALAFHANIPAYTSDRFRAEFVQYSSIGFGHASGPRIRELDGFSTTVVPEPSMLLWSLGAACSALTWRRRR